MVKEIIGITTDGKKFKKDKSEGERKLTEEERAEQEQRREKLLEAGK